MKTNIILKNIILMVFCLPFIVAPPANAAESDAQEETVYQDATFENFSKTYWRFRKFDVDDTKMIDSFMFINECNLYKEYHHNEFEWTGIREATREHIKDNKKKFPSDYQFVQPISLGEYDFDKKGFNIAEGYGLKGVNRLEVSSDKVGVEVCGSKYGIPGYPKVIALELTRPLIFDFFEMSEQDAQELISKKMKSYENLNNNYKNQKTRDAAREVYMVAKVKIFAYKPEDIRSKHGYVIAPMLSILEKIEVYSDKKLTKLLYEKDLRRKKHAKQKEF